MELIYETKSKLNLIRVFKDGKGIRYLRLGRGTEIHSMYDPTNLLFDDVEEHYWNYFNLIPVINKDVEDILMLGLGCGTAVKQLKHFFPSITIDAVEIDEDIIKAARNYFDLDLLSVNVIHGDGVEYLAHQNKKYDVIILDAFDRGNIAKPFLEKEVFVNAKFRLNRGGMMMINFLDQSPFTSVIKNRMLNTFDHVHFFQIEGTYNTLIIGSDKEYNFDVSLFDVEDQGLRKVLAYFKKRLRVLK